MIRQIDKTRVSREEGEEAVVVEGAVEEVEEQVTGPQGKDMVMFNRGNPKTTKRNQAKDNLVVNDEGLGKEEVDLESEEDLVGRDEVLAKGKALVARGKDSVLKEAMKEEDLEVAQEK